MINNSRIDIPYKLESWFLLRFLKPKHRLIYSLAKTRRTTIITKTIRHLAIFVNLKVRSFLMNNDDAEEGFKDCLAGFISWLDSRVEV